ncbi:HNH endonuclease [Streptomyces sp. NPDC002952]|uniref:HNH endonuclease n=1 Tax=Streptomyces sp. NPDC002952 TaxID=3364673 RepID=UPI0036B676F4
MAWEGSTRRARLPKDWPRTRRRILRRDGYECQTRFSDGRLCGLPANQVDHIEPGNDHRDANLQALCTWCHTHKSSSEGGTAAAHTRVRTHKPAPIHPALED